MGKCVRMKLNRKGVTRLVIELDKVVIKIPNFTYSWNHFLKGLLANMSENLTFRCAGIEGSFIYGQQHLLCPVEWMSWGGWILVMHKVDRVLDFDDHDKHDWSAHKKWFPGDDKVSNYGILNGRLVKLDYGQLSHSGEIIPYDSPSDK